MKGFHELNALELDTIREIGSIGTGNAATALSGMLGSKVSIEMPQVRIMGYNEAIDWIGGPEAVTAGVLVHLEGEINGIMLCVQQMDFVNLMLERMVGRRLDGYEQLKELDVSALLEVGNIMISAFVNALAGMTDMTIRLTVPAFAVDMQGAILAVPMAEFGGQSDYLMTIGTQFVCEGHAVPCRLLLSPDVRSLNFLLKRLGVLDER
ncbi:MAG: chemotaxis protein CheC [Lawsonibacter sp.]